MQFHILAIFVKSLFQDTINVNCMLTMQKNADAFAGCNVRIRIRKENGAWKTYFVYNENTQAEYEVFMDQYSELTEAHSVAMFVVKETNE